MAFHRLLGADLAAQQPFLRQEAGPRVGGRTYYVLDLTGLGTREDWEEPEGRTDSARSATPDFAS